MFHPRACSESLVGGMRQTFSSLGKLGRKTNFNTVPLWPSLVSIFNCLSDFHKFDNFSQFFCDHSAEPPKSGKDASQCDLNLSRQDFSSKMNSLAVIFEKPKKNAKNSRLCTL